LAVPALESELADAAKLMNDRLVTLTELFEKQGWGYQLDEKIPAVQTVFTGANGRWPCVGIADRDSHSVICLSLFPSKAPVKRHAACAELFVRINYSLKHGCFELDFEGGEIRFRTSVCCPSSNLTAELVEHLVLSNLCVVDHFYVAIMEVLYGNVSPKSALESSDAESSAKQRFEFN
jgi:hypothetical protein